MCTKCPPGKYQGGTGGKTCLFCGVNEYSPDYGASKCEPCQNGAFALANQANVVCQDCPTGKHRTATDAQCVPCASNTAQSKSGQAGCTSCTAGTVSNGEVANAVMGFSGRLFELDLQSCVPCPFGSYVKKKAAF